jgi:cell fate regulator YaaT (PSP1 superfamily)
MSETTETSGRTPRIIGVRFRTAGPVYPSTTGAIELRPGDRVVIETERGAALGTVARAADRQPPTTPGERTFRVIKRADARDLAKDDVNQQRARDAQRICLHRIRERRLSMKLIDIDCLFDGSKIVFYFSANERLDFRDLVRDLAQTLHTRIEMKQIGARDETKSIGGVGPCGRELCCSSWLTNFDGVSVKMAKDQGLSLNPSKLAGMCGRLKCCLRYEYDTYRELGKSLPAVGTPVVCVKGDGVVTHQNILKQTVMVRREDGTEAEVTLEDLVQQKA